MTLAISKFLNTATHFNNDTFVFNSCGVSYFNNTNLFFPINNSAGTTGQALAASIAVAMPALTIKRILAQLFNNSLTVAGSISVNVNGVDVATLAIPNGGQLALDSGALNVIVNSGDKACIHVNLPAGAGFIDLGQMVIQYQTVIS